MSLSPIASDAQIPDLGVSKEAGEFARGWTVLLAGTIGTGLGITGLPFFSFGQFVRPLRALRIPALHCRTPRSA